MIFHRYNNESFEKNDVFDVTQVLMRLAEKLPRVEISSQPDMLITSNLFALETIASNLLKNAVTYSPCDSDINVNLAALDNGCIELLVSNVCIHSLSKDDLQLMFDPLWQKDSSRTSTENFGLGLSIVNSFAKALGGSISVDVEGDVIHFRVILVQSA